jgi:hypothetical protein
MKKTTTLMAALLCFAGSTQASTYLKAPPMTLANAKAYAATLGGHLIRVDSEVERQLIDAQFNRPGESYFWTDTKAGALPGYSITWVNGDGLWNWFASTQSAPWHYTTSNRPTSMTSVLVLVRAPIFYRASIYRLKFYQFDRPELYTFPAIVEID